MLLNPPQEHPISLRDRLIFARYAEFTVHTSPERCFDRLRGLEQPRHGLFNAKSIQVKRGEINGGRDVHVSMRRYSRGAYTTAYFDAVVLATSDPETALVQGKFAVGLILWMPLLYWVIFSFVAGYLMGGGYLVAVFFAVIMAISFAIYAWQARTDYRTLQTLITDALQ